MGKERRACSQITLPQYLLLVHQFQLATPLSVSAGCRALLTLFLACFFPFMLDRKYKKRNLTQKVYDLIEEKKEESK